jgi:hypothetical protein
MGQHGPADQLPPSQQQAQQAQRQAQRAQRTSSWMVRISPSGLAPCSARHCAIWRWNLLRRWMRSLTRSLDSSGERAAGRGRRQRAAGQKAGAGGGGRQGRRWGMAGEGQAFERQIVGWAAPLRALAACPNSRPCTLATPTTISTPQPPAFHYPQPARPTDEGCAAGIGGRRHRDLHLPLLRVAQAPVEEPERLRCVAQVGALAVHQEVQGQLLQKVLPLLQAVQGGGGQYNGGRAHEALQKARAVCALDSQQALQTWRRRCRMGQAEDGMRMQWHFLAVVGAAWHTRTGMQSNSS